jgi:hypothetical protein
MTISVDEFFLNLLQDREVLSGAQVNWLRQRWQQERVGDEELIPYLIRSEICSEAAPILLELMRDETMPRDVKRLLRHRNTDLVGWLGTPPAAAPVPAATPTPAPVPAATPAAAAPALAAPATAAVAPAPLAAPAVAVKPAAPAVAVATEEVSTVANGETERLADALRSSQPAPAAPARQPLSLEIGSVLGRCLLLEKVGQGAAGMVFRGIHRSFNIPVAVKVLRANSLEVDAAAFQCFRREAQLLAKLNHPNIVRVWDFEDDPEFPYLVLEYVEGFSLAELIQQSGRLQAHRAVRIVRQTAMGLEAALQLGIIHRDVKPGNILLTRDGNVKLADLGLAVLVADLTGTGQRSEGMAGTAAYMSPEQAASGATVDHRSDIYALGATFYHMLTGHLPFTGRSAMEMLLKHAREPLVPPSEVVPGLDERISKLVVRMMAKKPQDRVQTYAELLAELDQVHQNDDSSGTVNPPSTSSRANPKRGSSIWSMFRNLGGGNRSDGSQ